jgi:type VI secretion system FHA domain protein
VLPDDFFAEESNLNDKSFSPDLEPPIEPDLAFDCVVESGSVSLGFTSEEELSPLASIDTHPSAAADAGFVAMPDNQAKGWGTADKALPETAEALDRGIGQHKAVVSDSELLLEFWAGAGISDIHLPSSDKWPEMIRMSGQLLRGMVEGLMQVLRARAELKSQFRVSVTTMRSVDNNPLKFTPNVDDAINLMLQPTNPGFLSPRESVQEGFSDIMNHQIAMTAGIQAALSEILRSFDPELIEKSQGEGLMFQKKAKCWDHYTDKYPQLKAAAQEGFFGDAFADAYEKQMLLLNRASKKQ